MDQVELNKVALSFIRTQSFEVAAKLRQTLVSDYKKRSQRIPGPVLHHIHNVAIFECMAWLNSLVALDKDSPREAINEFTSLAETLQPKFHDITDALKDFQPAA